MIDDWDTLSGFFVTRVRRARFASPPFADDWDTFVRSLAEHHAPIADAVLWRMTKSDREIVCHMRELRTGSDYVGLELRVAHNGAFYLSEVHKERVAFYRRVTELRTMLEAEGWM